MMMMMMMYFVQSSCILPRWTVYQQVVGMSKRPPPNIHRYRTKAVRFRQSLEKRMGWTKPLLEREEERKQKVLENAGKETEPHMLHVVYLLQKLKGRPWWEKKIAEKLELEYVCRFLLFFPPNIMTSSYHMIMTASGLLAFSCLS